MNKFLQSKWSSFLLIYFIILFAGSNLLLLRAEMDNNKSGSVNKTMALTGRFFTGQNAGDSFGNSVANAGDVNGDGYDDLIIGAPFSDHNGSSSGSAYIFFGGQIMDMIPDVIMYGEVAGDYFGNSVATAGDVNGDGYSDVIIGAYYNDDNGTFAGKVYIYYGGSIMDNTADVTMPGENSYDYFGYSVTTAGDVNGDGYSDVIVGAYENEDGGSSAGKTYIYYGGSNMNNIADITMIGENNGDYFGISVSTAGDVNGDGYSDVIIGAVYNDDGGTNAGKAYIYFGGSSMDNTVDVTMIGENSFDNFGKSVSTAGDVNMDGHSDVIVGAHDNDDGGTDAGKAYIYFGGSSMDNTPDVTMIGENSYDSFGKSVSTAGDVNGDGYSDVIVGAYGNDDGGSYAGKAYIYYGSSGMDNIAGVTMIGENSSDYFGYSVSTAGDVNGDGYSDVIVGAYGNDDGGSTAGKAYLYLNSLTGNDISDMFFTGEAAYDQLGYSVSTAGDVNGDGYDDLIVGAIYNDYGYSNGGRAYIYYGGPGFDNTPDVYLNSENAGDYFGSSVSKAGDVNGDGYDDVIVGATGYNDGTGRAYIFFGGSSMDNTPDIYLTGESAGDYFGYSVHTAGDFNGDGFSDVIVGAYQYDNFDNSDAGRVYIYYGGYNMDNLADIKITGQYSYDNFGNSVATAGDVNGDGYSDVIVGAHYNDAGGSTNAGKAYIFYGSRGTNYGVYSARVTMIGENSNDYFGYSVSSAGDVNGDGFSDVIVGAYYNDYGTGKAYIYYGGSSMDNSADVTMIGENSNDNFGFSVSSAGDVNNDGYSDVIVGANRWFYASGGSTYGKAYVYFGGLSMDNEVDIYMNGENSPDEFGGSVSSAGDVNGDGLDDIISGARYNNDAGSNAGKAYVFLSSAPPIKPGIMSVKDVANDQGGKVVVRWTRSGYDVNDFNKISSYTVQRSYPPGISGYAWTPVATIDATKELQYFYECSTSYDSSSNSSGTFYFRVTANTNDGNEYWDSNIKYGHSVDNLSPSAPANLSAAVNTSSVDLTWDENTESDLKQYVIYKQTSSPLLTETEPLAATTENTYTDNEISGSTIYYFVKAEDIHENESGSIETLVNIELNVNIKIFLEGAYSGGSMSTLLNSSGLIPLSQPYNAAPWNYAGTESVASIPSADIVDWILVELRSDETTVVETRAGFLKSDGTIVDTDGTSYLKFPNSTSGDYYVVFIHRNHLAVMTSQKITLSHSSELYNMCQSASSAYGTGSLNEMTDGYFTTYAADANGNGQIQNNDREDFWKIQNGQGGYYCGDFNLNGQVQNNDLEDFFKANNGVGSQVPVGTTSLSKVKEEK